MKANRKGWKKKALAATLLFGMAAGAFGVGFSAFVLSDPSLGEVGSLDVTFGDAAFIEMDRASASCFSCAPRGFLQSDGKTYGPQASMSVSFAYYVHSEQSFRLDFSLRQEEATPGAHPGFDLLSSLSSWRLLNRRAQGGPITADQALAFAPIAGEAKAVRASCSSDEVSALGAGLTFFMTLEMQFDASALCAANPDLDFAKNVYRPLRENGVSFALEVDVHA